MITGKGFKGLKISHKATDEIKLGPKLITQKLKLKQSQSNHDII